MGELSILIHSVLIGFDMGLQTKSVWIPLCIAISFHQFFEGFAVAQILLDAKFGFWKKFAMTAFYSLTTSVGIVIGICTYTGHGYDPVQEREHHDWNHRFHLRWSPPLHRNERVLDRVVRGEPGDVPLRLPHTTNDGILGRVSWHAHHVRHRHLGLETCLCSTH